MKIYGLVCLGLVNGNRDTNGDWKTSNGDVVQLFGNEMFVMAADGSFTNGVALISESNGFTSVSFQDKNGKATTGFVSEDGQQVMFTSHDLWQRDNDRLSLTSTDTPEATTLLPLSEFAAFAGEWTNDNGDVVALVDNDDGRVSVMLLVDGAPVVVTLADVTTVDGLTVLSWDDNGNTVTATINAGQDRITFGGTISEFDGQDWFRTLPTTAAATTAAATTAAATTAAATTTAAVAATTTAAAEIVTTTAAAVVATTTANAIAGGANGAETTAAAAAATTTVLSGAGLAGIMGDPHVRIHNPNEEAVCFDFNVDHNAFVYLLQDVELGLTVTAEMTSARTKFNPNKPTHSHISTIEIDSAAGTKIKLQWCDESKLSLLIQDAEYDMNTDQTIFLDDAFVEVVSHLKARHQGILVTFLDGPEMHISVKDSKGSLRFELTNSHGISSTVEGLLGHSIRPADYHIDQNGVITVEGRAIQGATRSWMDHDYCHVLTGADVFTFLGKTMNDFIVPDALTGTLEEIIKPK